MTWFDWADDHLAKWKARRGTPVFTAPASQVLALARQEADRLGQDYLGTEHLLLGLIKFEQGMAAEILRNLGLSLETVLKEVKYNPGKVPRQKASSNIPYTPRMTTVMAQAQKYAQTLNRSVVDTEHLFLGLLAEREGPAARIFQHFKVNVEQTRNGILKTLETETGQAGGNSA